MSWWNDLWLNEGFASFLEYLAVDELMPSWAMMEQFVLDKTQPGLALDALSSSHSITVAVHDPTEIEALFDTISYSKGACLLYMIERFLGEETMRKGLTDYLNTHKYGNADTKDLWAVLTKHANNTVQIKTIMETWTRQMGFPVVTLKRDGQQVIATQHRFLLTPGPHVDNSTTHLEPRSPFSYKWYIPLSFYTDVSPTNTVWMNMSDVKFEIEREASWLKANVNQSGFYRVNYDQNNWKALIDTLRQNHSRFSAADRANLIDDAFTLCRAGLLNVTTVLELTRYLEAEEDYVPWSTVLGHMQAWARYLSEASPYRLFLDFMTKIITPRALSIGWNNTGTHLNKLMRGDILASAVLLGVDDSVKEAKQRFSDWMNKGIPVPANLREIVYTAGVKYGGVKEWQFCWNKYNTTRVPSERKLLLKVLGAASDPWILQRYLLATLDRDKIKPQDIKVVLATVASNPEGRLMAWRHLKAHWGSLQGLFGNGTYSLGGIIAAVTSHFSTDYDYREVALFFRYIDIGSGTRALEQSLESIDLNIHWVKTFENPLFVWLNKFLNS